MAKVNKFYLIKFKKSMERSETIILGNLGILGISHFMHFRHFHWQKKIDNRAELIKKA